MGLLRRPWRTRRAAPCLLTAPSSLHTAPSSLHTALSSTHTAPSSLHTAPSAHHGRSNTVLLCWVILLSTSLVFSASAADLSSKQGSPDRIASDGSSWRRRDQGFEAWSHTPQDGAVHHQRTGAVIPQAVTLRVGGSETSPQSNPEVVAGLLNHNSVVDDKIRHSQWDELPSNSDTLKHARTLPPLAHSVQKQALQQQQRHPLILHGDSGVPAPVNSKLLVLNNSLDNNSHLLNFHSANASLIQYKDGTNAIASDIGSIFNSSVLVNVNSRANSLPDHVPHTPVKDTLLRRVRRVPQSNPLQDDTEPSVNLTASASSVTSHQDSTSTTRSSSTNTRDHSGIVTSGPDSLFRRPDDEAPPSTLNCSSYVGHEAEPGVHLVTLRWKEVGVYFTITAFVIFAGLGKLGFHQLHWLSSKVPESCLLIVLGLIMGLILYFTTHETDPSATCHHHVEFPTFTSEAFFLVLLPPIILESAYSLHDRSFIDNLGTVLVFAVFGTLMNVFIIGPTLFGLAAGGAMGNFNITLTESLVFSSLISAVDPVAVLNIFQDLGVNKGLYFLVFGESLLNDGVTVVVYNTLSVFMEMPTVKATDYVLSVVAFFVVALCGALIGLLYGLITSLVTRVTTTVRVVEPLALLGFAYLAYLSAEMFHFSGIISLIVCGLVQAHYAFQNISGKSYTCVKYFTKMASATSETIIFMFLGMVLVSEEHAWHTGFVLWTLALCFITRFLITLALSAITNRYRTHAIGISEQLILAYGGLRGAVAFSLVTMLPEDLALRGHFITATLAVILFTVFIQGITIRPLVNWLDVSKRHSGRRQLLEEVHVNVVDHMMAGIEEVLGQHGDFYLREQLRFYNEKYLKRWFVRPTSEAPLKRLFEKIAITEHYAHLYGPAVLLQEQQLSGSRQKLVESSPYSSKHASVQCLITTSTEVPLDVMTLDEALPGALPAESVQLRGSVRKPSARKDTKLNLSPGNSLEADAKILRRAISSNPYNQLHYTYNRNLVNADNQEMTDHLHRRREQARRLTRLASQSSMRQSTLTLPRAEDTPPPLLTNNNAWMSSSGTSAARTTTDTSSRDTAPAGTTAYPSERGNRMMVEELDGSSVPSHEMRPRPTEQGYAGSDHLTRRDTITMTPEEIIQLRQTDQRRKSGWNPSRMFLDRMVSLPGESTKGQIEDLDDLPHADELADDIRKVNNLIDCHRRRSAFRQSARRRWRGRTHSEGGEEAPWGGYDDRPPSSAGGGQFSSLVTTPEIPESGYPLTAPSFSGSADHATARDPLLRPAAGGEEGRRGGPTPREEGRGSPSDSSRPSSHYQDTNV